MVPSVILFFSLFQVYSGIWIGNKGVAEDVSRLSAMGVTHLLNCAGGVSGVSQPIRGLYSYTLSNQKRTHL